MKNLEILHSDDEVEIEPAAHKRLLAGVNQIVKTQHVKKPTRCEPSVKKTEFHLNKNTLKKKKNPTLVNVDNLLKILDKSSTHSKLGKKLQKVQKSQTLRTPLLKHELDKVERSVGYKKVSDQLDRWDAVITKNRIAEQQIFPIVDASTEMQIFDNAAGGEEFFSCDSRFKSDLMKEMEKLEPPPQYSADPLQSDVPLTLEEMKERSYELARRKQLEAYKIAKGRRKNKIKSKTYHKLLKREKLKQQLKNFESLQKSDPELALRELEKIDKHRALERISLRHKNTGTWAKNVKVRAKYDKDARQILEEQIQLSRELTAKNDDNSEDSEVEEEEMILDNDENPWTGLKGPKDDKDFDDFTDSYKKYWSERNENEVKRQKYDSLVVPDNVIADDEEDDETDEDEEEDAKAIESFKKKIEKTVSTTNWDVDDLEEVKSGKKVIEKSIDEIFDEAEEQIKDSVDAKLNKLRVNYENSKKATKKKKQKGKKESKVDLAFKETKQRVAIDEEFNQEESEEVARTNLINQKIPDAPEVNINPEKFVAIKPKHLLTAIPSLDDADGDEDYETQQRITIAEAFQDDDIVADFVQEKEEEKNKNAPKDIDLTLPGWGSWAGSGMRPQRKRIVFKMPETVPRKDDNKKRLIVNEAANEKFKSHLVSQLPFPFTSVRDYEASIRSPIGKEFVPQTAHKVLTKPQVVTRLGKIIKPMTEKELFKNSKNKKGLKDIV